MIDPMDIICHQEGLLRNLNIDNAKLRSRIYELLKVSKALVDVDFHYGPEIGDIRAHYTNGTDAMSLINATRRLIEEIERITK